MIERDFQSHGILNYTATEVRGTNARLRDVQLELMLRMQTFRMILQRRVILLENGLTTGNHRNICHPQGLAGDCTLDSRDGPIKILNVFKASLDAGFKGIGIYWNGKAYSFHLDLRPAYAFWNGVKRPGKEWKYHSLILDPKYIKMNNL